MSFQKINQFHKSGCLIACLAMITKRSYKEICYEMFPDRPYLMCSNVINVGTNLAYLPLILKSFNIKFELSDIKDLSLLKKNALIILNWRNQPTLSHCVLFDKETLSIIEPSSKLSRICSFKTYQRHLHSVILLK